VDSFEWNKIAAAALVALMLVTVVRLAAEDVFDREQAPVAGMAEETPAPVEAAVVEGPSFTELLATANLQKGADSFRKCQACHIDDRSGATKIGPNLWGVVGRPTAHLEGFSYSKAMQEKGGTWTFDALDTFLTTPQGTVPGTKMSFAGIRNAAERANVIAYLNSQSDSPLPLPEPPPPPPAETEGAAEQPAT
jgi:cytochrome c